MSESLHLFDNFLTFLSLMDQMFLVVMKETNGWVWAFDSSDVVMRSWDSSDETCLSCHVIYAIGVHGLGGTGCNNWTIGKVECLFCKVSQVEPETWKSFQSFDRTWSTVSASPKIFEIFSWLCSCWWFSRGLNCIESCWSQPNVTQILLFDDRYVHFFFVIAVHVYIASFNSW